MWYDDHRGGVDSGHLSLGQETTTNTYEGHEFFFTDYQDKSKIYARFRMESGTVSILIGIYLILLILTVGHVGVLRCRRFK